MTLPVIDPVVSENTGGTGTITIGEPGTSGTSVDDAVIIVIASDNNNPASKIFDDVTNKPTGFDLIAEHGLVGGNNQDCQGAAYQRIIDGTEVWPITCQTNGGVGLIVQAIRLSSVDTAALVNQVGTVQEPNNTGSSLTIPGVTTDQDDCTVFYFNSTDGADTLPHSPDGSWTEGDELGDGGGAGGTALSWGYLDLPTAGASGNVTVSYSATDGRGGFQFAIKGESAAATANITANQTEEGDTTAAALETIVQLSANQTEEGDTTAAALETIVQLSANQTEEGDTTAAALATQQFANITASQTEEGDATTADISAVASVSANQTEEGDTTAAALTPVVEITANQTEEGDTTAAALATQQFADITASQTEEGDTTAAALETIVQITANQTEEGDATAAAVGLVAQITANQLEEGDTTAASLSEQPQANITANQLEEGDTTSAWIGLPPDPTESFKVTIAQRRFKLTVAERIFKVSA